MFWHRSGGGGPFQPGSSNFTSYPGARTLIPGIGYASRLPPSEMQNLHSVSKYDIPKSISQEEYKAWDEVIVGCLKADYWVTLDFGVEHIEGVLESCYSEYPRFVPMISVKLPYINQLNYNATLKLDDRTWGATNPGVWTHQLHDLMSKDKYTYWDQYTKDTTVS
jgi:hypothetical protein